MKYYKMLWGDVTRMLGDFRFPRNSWEHLEFAPNKEDYQEFGNPAMLYKALVFSFRASSKKLSVRKWVVDEVGELPVELKQVKQKKTRWNIDFIKVEEPEEEKIEEEVEEVKEQEILEEEKGVELWQL